MANGPHAASARRGFLEQDGVAGGQPLRVVVVAAAEHAGQRQAARPRPAEHQRVAGAQAGVAEGEAAEPVAAVRIDAGVVEDEVGAEGRRPRRARGASTSR